MNCVYSSTYTVFEILNDFDKNQSSKFENNKLSAVWGQVISAMLLKLQDDTLRRRAQGSRHT
jgi:hypothetical protein